MAEKIQGIYTIKEAAEIIGKSERQIWRYVHSPKPEYLLKTCWIGNRQVVKEQDLNDFMKRLEETPIHTGRPKKEK